MPIRAIKENQTNIRINRFHTLQQNQNLALWGSSETDFGIQMNRTKIHNRPIDDFSAGLR